MRRARGVRFTYDYLPGHRPVSVVAIPFSQLAPRHHRPVAPWCNDRRWNRELVEWHELCPEGSREPWLPI